MLQKILCFLGYHPHEQSESLGCEIVSSGWGRFGPLKRFVFHKKCLCVIGNMKND